MRLGKAQTLAGFVVTVLLFSTSQVSAKNELERGWAAYARGDHATAAKFIRPYAEQGDAEAQFMLGRIYQQGEGVPQNYDEAVKWYVLSAEAGLPYAQNNLGVMYKNGWGVERDNVKAHFWFTLAIRSYFAFEGMNMERARLNKQAVAANMTPSEISQSQQLAEKWVPSSSGADASTSLLGP